MLGVYLISELAKEKRDTSLLPPFRVSFHSPLHRDTTSTADCALSTARSLLVWEAKMDTSSAYIDTVMSLESSGAKLLMMLCYV